MAAIPSNSYEERFIAFVDMLGFSDLLEGMDADAEIYDTVMNSLYGVMAEEFRVRWGDERKEDYTFEYAMLNLDEALASSEKTGAQMTAFSDCYLVSERIERLPYLIARVHRLAGRLLRSGVIVRGGIVRGRIHHRHRVAFGPGMVDAYRTEQGTAKYPRIVVQPTVADAYLAFERDFLAGVADEMFGRSNVSLLDRDVDGCWFINPFVEVAEYNPFGPGVMIWTPGWEKTFRHIRDQLVNRLQFELRRGVEPHIAKIRWLIFQFNKNMRAFVGNVPLINPDHPK